jgi:hypothetical protein
MPIVAACAVRSGTSLPSFAYHPELSRTFLVVHCWLVRPFLTGPFVNYDQYMISIRFPHNISTFPHSSRDRRIVLWFIDNVLDIRMKHWTY